jgi:hypothetical protein
VVIIVSDSVQLWVYLEQLELVLFLSCLGDSCVLGQLEKALILPSCGIVVSGTVRAVCNSVQLWDSCVYHSLSWL